uniref:Uncharacterized protein n=1 Tax=Chromera velia CCMP2878 TaxID=1169474 RepID=A0A0G4GIX2_9ALVE|eukprot:Cvel_22096.t1-p1 / transcript=Cvel_22096.t1 / gene=Cvel_22096 / organism=Chromera_velia_CCMP2878 / gene_product=hypothetical protein / transcript_product=hypothetical protein / location=Cvel_scaffold2138:25365-32823(+) / protein_length=1433 / sequence_SO=supercontig / SO=protein_coding / is_pseudo=false
MSSDEVTGDCTSPNLSSNERDVPLSVCESSENTGDVSFFHSGRAAEGPSDGKGDKGLSPCGSPSVAGVGENERPTPCSFPPDGDGDEDLEAGEGIVERCRLGDGAGSRLATRATSLSGHEVLGSSGASSSSNSPAPSWHRNALSEGAFPLDSPEEEGVMEDFMGTAAEGNEDMYHGGSVYSADGFSQEGDDNETEGMGEREGREPQGFDNGEWWGDGGFPPGPPSDQRGGSLYSQGEEEEEEEEDFDQMFANDQPPEGGVAVEIPVEEFGKGVETLHEAFADTFPHPAAPPTIRDGTVISFSRAGRSMVRLDIPSEALSYAAAKWRQMDADAHSMHAERGSLFRSSVRRNPFVPPFSGTEVQEDVEDPSGVSASSSSHGGGREGQREETGGENGLALGHSSSSPSRGSDAPPAQERRGVEDPLDVRDDTNDRNGDLEKREKGHDSHHLSVSADAPQVEGRVGEGEGEGDSAADQQAATADRCPEMQQQSVGASFVGEEGDSSTGQLVEGDRIGKPVEAGFSVPFPGRSGQEEGGEVTEEEEDSNRKKGEASVPLPMSSKLERESSSSSASPSASGQPVPLPPTTALIVSAPSAPSSSPLKEAPCEEHHSSNDDQKPNAAETLFTTRREGVGNVCGGYGGENSSSESHHSQSDLEPGGREGGETQREGGEEEGTKVPQADPPKTSQSPSASVFDPTSRRAECESNAPVEEGGQNASDLFSSIPAVDSTSESRNQSEKQAAAEEENQDRNGSSSGWGAGSVEGEDGCGSGSGSPFPSLFLSSGRMGPSQGGDTVSYSPPHGERGGGGAREVLSSSRYMRRGELGHEEGGGEGNAFSSSSSSSSSSSANQSAAVAAASAVNMSASAVPRGGGRRNMGGTGEALTESSSSSTAHRLRGAADVRLGAVPPGRQQAEGGDGDLPPPSATALAKQHRPPPLPLNAIKFKPAHFLAATSPISEARSDRPFRFLSSSRPNPPHTSIHSVPLRCPSPSRSSCGSVPPLSAAFSDRTAVKSPYCLTGPSALLEGGAAALPSSSSQRQQQQHGGAVNDRGGISLRFVPEAASSEGSPCSDRGSYMGDIDPTEQLSDVFFRQPITPFLYTRSSKEGSANASGQTEGSLKASSSRAAVQSWASSPPPSASPLHTAAEGRRNNNSGVPAHAGPPRLTGPSGVRSSPGLAVRRVQLHNPFTAVSSESPATSSLQHPSLSQAQQPAAAAAAVAECSPAISSSSVANHRRPLTDSRSTREKRGADGMTPFQRSRCLAAARDSAWCAENIPVPRIIGGLPRQQQGPGPAPSSHPQVDRLPSVREEEHSREPRQIGGVGLLRDVGVNIEAPGEDAEGSSGKGEILLPSLDQSAMSTSVSARGGERERGTQGAGTRQTTAGSPTDSDGRPPDIPDRRPQQLPGQHPAARQNFSTKGDHWERHPDAKGLTPCTIM